MDDQPPENRRRGAGKRGGATTAADGAAAVATTAPCGACKFLRRKCISGCIFAPHFGSDQGGARFAAVHKVFGASNVSKLLSHIPAHRRNDAVVTISYQAQARLSDPVYGCVSTIVALQHQVASLQAELSMVQTELINSRFAMENALQNELQQPSYSNTSSVSNNLLNMRNNFSPNFTENANSFDPVLHISSRHIQNEDEEDEDEESHDPAVVFANHIFQ